MAVSLLMVSSAAVGRAGGAAVRVRNHARTRTRASSLLDQETVFGQGGRGTARWRIACGKPTVHGDACCRGCASGDREAAERIIKFRCAPRAHEREAEPGEQRQRDEREHPPIVLECVEIEPPWGRGAATGRFATGGFAATGGTTAGGGASTAGGGASTAAGGAASAGVFCSAAAGGGGVGALLPAVSAPGLPQLQVCPVRGELRLQPREVCIAHIEQPLLVGELPFEFLYAGLEARFATLSTGCRARRGGLRRGHQVQASRLPCGRSSPARAAAPRGVLAANLRIRLRARNRRGRGPSGIRSTAPERIRFMFCSKARGFAW